MGAEAIDRRVGRLVSKAEADSDVLAVLLFGSAARGEAGKGSDVDVCLVLRAQVAGPLEASEKRLAYLSEFDLDVHVFQRLPLFVRRRVLREGRTLHCKDEDALYELAYRTARAWTDFRPRYLQYLEAVLGS